MTDEPTFTPPRPAMPVRPSKQEQRVADAAAQRHKPDCPYFTGVGGACTCNTVVSPIGAEEHRQAMRSAGKKGVSEAPTFAPDGAPIAPDPARSQRAKDAWTKRRANQEKSDPGETMTRAEVLAVFPVLVKVTELLSPLPRSVQQALIAVLGQVYK